MVPPLDSCTAQITAESLLPLTLAAKAWVAPGASEMLPGVTVTLMPPWEQAAQASASRTTRRGMDRTMFLSGNSLRCSFNMQQVNQNPKDLSRYNCRCSCERSFSPYSSTSLLQNGYSLVD